MTRSDSRKALGKGLHSLLPGRGGSQSAERTTEIAAEPPGERILKVPVGQIRPNSNQPRSDFDENALIDLTHSVGRDGILQPIVARRVGAERYEIIAGERRWRAAQRAGLTHVPIVVRDADENRALELALIENIQREDLNPIELAHAFEHMSELGLRHDEIGAKTGKDRVTVTNALRLLQLPEEVQGLIATRRLSPGHARALLKIEGDEERKEAARRCIGEGWSVRQIEEYTRPKRARLQPDGGSGNTAAAPDSSGGRAADPNIRAAEAELQENLGTKVRIVSRGHGCGQVEIEYYSEEDLQRIYELLMSAKA